jgi:hypothetical protein
LKVDSLEIGWSSSGLAAKPSFLRSRGITRVPLSQLSATPRCDFGGSSAVLFDKEGLRPACLGTGFDCNWDSTAKTRDFQGPGRATEYWCSRCFKLFICCHSSITSTCPAVD